MTGPYAPQQQIAPSPVAPPLRGKGLIIAGAVMIAVAVLGAMIGSGLLGADVGFSDLEREVAIDGASDRVVPGEIEFSVLEPLDDATPEMTVGLALSSNEDPRPTCTIEDSGGGAVEVDVASLNEALLDLEGRYGEYTVVSTARLGPGDYRASCEVTGEPSASSGVSFTVGRVFGVADVGEMFGPLLGLLALWGVAGLVFIVGMVLLIVGLVQRSRSKRLPPMVGQYQQGPYQQGPPPSGPYQQGPHQQGPYQQGPYQQGPYQQGPYQQGPQAQGPQAQAPYGAPPTGSPPTYAPSAPPPAPPDAPDAPPGPPSGPPAAAPPAAPPEGGGTTSGWTVPPSKH